MQLMIRTYFLASLFLLLNPNLRAGTSIVRPIFPLSARFLAHIRHLDEPWARAVSHSPGGTKICSCQILNLQSNNYNHQNIALFAEKTNRGQYPKDLNKAKQAIEKEKKHLRDLFYDRLSVVGSFSETLDCKSLYSKLKIADHSLVLYDILDADVQTGSQK